MHELDLPWPAPPLNLNDRRGRHDHASLVRAVRQDVGTIAQAARMGRHKRVRVTLHYRPGVVMGQKAVRRRRDEDNLQATAKPCCDALVDAGLVPDDIPEHMVKPSPVIHPIVPGARARVWLVVEVLR